MPKACRLLKREVWFMVFYTIFNSISAMSWQSVLLVEEIGVPAENHRLKKFNLYYNVLFLLFIFKILQSLQIYCLTKSLTFHSFQQLLYRIGLIL